MERYILHSLGLVETTYGLKIGKKDGHKQEENTKYRVFNGSPFSVRAVILSTYIYDRN